MTDTQKELLSRLIGNLLRFYGHGRDGVIPPPQAIWILQKMREQCPECVEEIGEDFLLYLGELTRRFYFLGVESSQ